MVGFSADLVGIGGSLSPETTGGSLELLGSSFGALRLGAFGVGDLMLYGFREAGVGTPLPTGRRAGAGALVLGLAAGVGALALGFG